MRGKTHNNPFLSGVVLNIRALDPKKPNSGHRVCGRIRLSNGREVTAYCPGEGNDLQEHQRVLIKGGRVKDIPGVKYKIVRGTAECSPVNFNDKEGKPHRRQGRSKTGTKKPRAGKKAGAK